MKCTTLGWACEQIHQLEPPATVAQVQPYAGLSTGDFEIGLMFRNTFRTSRRRTAYPLQDKRSQIHGAIPT